jgi:DNA uptake protein ComE-like DNA-binding protein
MFGALLLAAAMAVSCSPSQDTDKTRQQAADAAAQIKAGSKVAAVEIKKGAVEAGKQGKAIAEGVKEGWTAESKKVNINRASRTQLLTLPGMDEDSAQRIVDGRPYHTKDELSTKGIVSPEEFQKIQGLISVNSN